MSQNFFLTRLIEKLESAGIPYMISGSLGSSLHGEPRATNDIDLIIAPTSNQMDTFIKSLNDEYYVSPESVLYALKNHSMFNIIDYKTGWKADLIIRKNRPFSVEEFKRRRKGFVIGIEVWVISPEDAILSKLEWAKIGQSETQFRDALGVVIIQWQNIDKNYLQKWAKELHIEEILEKLLKEAEKLPELNSSFDITQDPIFQMKGYDSDAPPDLSVNIDKYLYGEGQTE